MCFFAFLFLLKFQPKKIEIKIKYFKIVCVFFFVGLGGVFEPKIITLIMACKKKYFFLQIARGVFVCSACINENTTFFCSGRCGYPGKCNLKVCFL